MKTLKSGLYSRYGLFFSTGAQVMSRKWSISVFLLSLLVSSTSFAAKPIKAPSPSPAPEVHSIKIDYNGGLILVEGVELHAVSATATLAGVTLILDGSSTDTNLVFSFSPALSAVVDELGNYVLNLTTDGGSFSASAFIPFALEVKVPLPPGEDCPCSPEWDLVMSTPSPGGVAGQTPYCDQDGSGFITVQFYDFPASNYWVMWADWDGGSGSCELLIDADPRPLADQAEFDACVDYLRDIVEVWGSDKNVCYF
jgi:hypothetical protein